MKFINDINNAYVRWQGETSSHQSPPKLALDSPSGGSVLELISAMEKLSTGATTTDGLEACHVQYDGKYWLYFKYDLLLMAQQKLPSQNSMVKKMLLLCHLTVCHICNISSIGQR